MMSRELTFDFDFWSLDHLRMAVKHLPIKFGAYIFIQSACLGGAVGSVALRAARLW